MKKLISLLILVVTLFAATNCTRAGKGDTVVIGGKNFTEQDILVYIMRDIIEAKTDIKVDTKAFLGGTNVVAQAIEKGELDIYAEYTGTALVNILGLEVMNDPQGVYDKVKQEYKDKKNIVWLKPLGFNNTYTLAMRKDKAESLKIETFSDLVKHAPNLVIGCTHEFLERPDGLAGLKDVYGINFKDARGMDPGLTYEAVRDGKVDVNDAFATDGRIPAFNLKVLKDDKRYFPPYFAAPIVRQDTLDKHPEIADALNLLEEKLSDEMMAKLNAQVDLEGKDAKDVARDWLKSEGLID